MDTWFSARIDESFTTFGASHLVMLAIYVIVSVFILSTPAVRKRSTRFHTLLRVIFLSLLILSEVSYQVWTILHGYWMEGSHLPLHLCGIASLVGVFALLTYHPKLIKITYFIGILPAAIALITPDIPHDFQHFRFWKFFVHHMAISWTGLFLIVSTTVKIKWRDFLETFLYLGIYSILIHLFNQYTGTNYLYLEGPPIPGTPLDWMGNGIAYTATLVMTAFSLFAVMVIFYKLAGTKKRTVNE
ncbi:TIGR02206 family membrane protein [Halobacillus litoralis]|uniref:YwaF family protein n=1 Tax=Halobacillus litoralis TaxID=45668 RepID=UPI001CFF3FC6|nr:TIGR02206 family membrane protein [Halobacillus litoralis]